MRKEKARPRLVWLSQWGWKGWYTEPGHLQTVLVETGPMRQAPMDLGSNPLACSSLPPRPRGSCVTSSPAKPFSGVWSSKEVPWKPLHQRWRESLQAMSRRNAMPLPFPIWGWRGCASDPVVLAPPAVLLAAPHPKAPRAGQTPPRTSDTPLSPQFTRPVVWPVAPPFGACREAIATSLSKRKSFLGLTFDLPKGCLKYENEIIWSPSSPFSGPGHLEAQMEGTT